MTNHYNERILKDHVTLKPGEIMLKKVSFDSQEEINFLYIYT